MSLTKQNVNLHSKKTEVVEETSGAQGRRERHGARRNDIPRLGQLGGRA